MLKNKLTVHVVLDRSGSMSIIQNDAIGGFNSYVETLVKDVPKAKLSLTIFDSQSIDTIIDNVPITEVQPLTTSMYQPRGMTPLLDAIGKTATLLEGAKGKNKALVIITDGQENASREHTKASIKKLLEDKQEKDNWLVLFLAANQDAFTEGAALGTRMANTANYVPTAAGMTNTMNVAAASTARYATSGGNLQSAELTEDERKKAMDEQS